MEGAFVEAYNRIIGSDDYFLNEFLSRSEEYISDGSVELSKAKNAKDVEANQGKIDKLAGMFIDGTMSEDAYQAKLRGLNAEKQRLLKEKEELEFKQQMEIDATSRILTFKKVAVECSGKKLDSFSKDLYNACVNKVVVGGYDAKGNPEPYTITFVFKGEFGNNENTAKGDDTYQVVSEFNFFYQHSVFKEVGRYGRKKEL